MTQAPALTDPAALLASLIRCPSVTPAEGGALDALQAMLEPLGFKVERVTFSEEGTADVENLYARLGDAGPHIMFAGHTDVVPVGDPSAWSHDPFGAETVNGQIYGRGAVDMKGGIAAFAAACARLLEGRDAPSGSISFLITGDEEGPSINGTEKLLRWAAERGERWDAAIVGEPTNPEAIGDMVKIGRRGSLSGTVVVTGVQGHVAYPHLAANPIPIAAAICRALTDPAFDDGTDAFPATNLELTSLDVGNPATNVIPARATLAFNVRFNDRWDVEALQSEIHNRIDRALEDQGTAERIEAEIVWRDRPSPVFLTRDDALIAAISDAIMGVTGRSPTLSTTGGTSDARFIKDYCPVVEFGLVGQTMHMVDERVALDDLERLTAIYRRFLESWFA